MPRHGTPDRWLGVRKDRVLATGLLLCLEDLQGLVYGEDLGIECLFVVAQVKAPAGPTLPGMPGARYSHLATVALWSVGPDGTPDPPVPGRLQGRALAVDAVVPREGSALAPDLRPYCLPWPGAGCCPEPGGNGSIVPLQILIRTSVLGSSQQPLRKTSPSMIQQDSSRGEAALRRKDALGGSSDGA